MPHQKEFEEALRHSAPYEQLRHLARELAVQGQAQQQVYDAFECFRVYLREAGREDDEDMIMEVMDCIVGWCSPDARLFPCYLEE